MVNLIKNEIINLMSASWKNKQAKQIEKSEIKKKTKRITLPLPINYYFVGNGILV